MSSKYSFLIVTLLVSFRFIGQNDLTNKIESLISVSQNDSAYVVTQKAIKNSKTNSEERADYYIKYARILKSLYKTDSCFYYLDKAEKFYKEKQDKSKQFYILTIKAEVSRALVKRNMANNYIYEAEKLFTKNKNPDYKYYYLNRRMALLAEYYNTTPDSLIKIKEIGNLILGNESKIKDKTILVYTLNELGFLDFNRNPKNGLKYFLKAFGLAEKYNTKIAYVDVCISLGRFYQQHEFDYKSALIYHNKGLKKAKEINNLFQMQQCYNEIKNCYVLQQEYKNAFYYRDSLANIDLMIEGFTNSRKYDILENKFIIEGKEQELKEYKKNIYLLIIILASLFTGIFIMYFYNKKIRSKNRELKKLNDENKFLVSETNHRVNNNLQVVNLLINELISKFKKKKHQKELESLLIKVDTIATLHRHLYQTKNNDLINLNEYLTELSLNFTDSFNKKNIVSEFKLANIILPAEKAMFLGLLTTELIINSLKHAFKEDQTKEISLKIESQEDTILYLFSDNGENSKGKEIEPKLVSQICLQLESKCEISTLNGFNFKLILKK
jgi:two-component system, sensor histidine kinase PdtaS